jgi:hypothetical protein
MADAAPVPPIDRHKLKQAADKLAVLLNDFQSGGLTLTSYGDGWHVFPGSGWDGRRYALVDNPHGYWDTTEVNGPDPAAPAPEASLVDRLRAITAEVEALTASRMSALAEDPRSVGRALCASRYQTHVFGLVACCQREDGHPGVHTCTLPDTLATNLGLSESARSWQWMTWDEVKS